MMNLINQIGGWVQSASTYGMESAGHLLSQIDHYAVTFADALGMRDFRIGSCHLWENKKIEVVKSYLFTSFCLVLGLRALKTGVCSVSQKNYYRSITHTIAAVALLGLAAHEIYTDITKCSLLGRSLKAV